MSSSGFQLESRSPEIYNLERKSLCPPLAGLLCWLERCPMQQKFVGRIPGHILGQRTCRRQLIDVSHTNVSLSQINKHIPG